MNTELVSISDLTPDPANARKHGERNLSSIIDSLRAFGQQKPIVVDRRGVVIAGNGTLEAAKRLGWEEIAIVRTELDPTQATAFGIADNRTAELAEWDEEVLVSLLDSLDDETRDLLHFDEKELEAMVPKATVEVVEDEVPDEVEPRTKPGDLWLLGRHRVLCGDSTNAEDVERLVKDDKTTAIFTDPPYGINYSDTKGRFNKIANDESDPSSLVAESISFYDAESIYLCCNWKCLQSMVEAMKSNGIEPKATIVWDKGSRIQNLDRYAKRHEFILYSGPYGGQPTVDDDVWQISRETRDDHPTAKPVELCFRALKHSTTEGDLVVDPFLGSGTTLIAAEQLGRKCYGMEISPQYCDVIVQRWENLTGETAVLEA
jgi:DNA modification methylase